jgi:hypothetical protein
MRAKFVIWMKVLLAAAICSGSWIAYPQTFRSSGQRASERELGVGSVCDNTAINPAASQALRLTCQHAPVRTMSSTSTQVIVIGFAGGFVNPDDLRHPEVLFASYIRDHYGNKIHARIFSNHDARDALSYAQRLLDTDRDGRLSNEERKNARIIIYGHSWGASETAAFARELGRLAIPVLLTIQLDIISKPGQNPTSIPRNVANAINLYQSEGALHGRPTITAVDPTTTKILGNIRMEYHGAPVNCGNYNWFVRTFNKPHHEIENDPHVWEQAASLIDAQVAGTDRSIKSSSSTATSGRQDLPSSMIGREKLH